ncbi:hypothetical protein CIL05_00195 [Virgibacillus profundi]|uniref:Transposase n=1 Tax=Virgibacillus profundi TaxID=2024555 RepID=A0A2A2IJ45_9BACI|nr:hypothetical protein [Virgibacillus profundi]PAV31115.1 hypothetical protein CIL05_00195 [Virgibacillus profundi]PXY55298.1 hypothetical protein CIT14_00195 [Virgibacillus profundi]
MWEKKKEVPDLFGIFAEAMVEGKEEGRAEGRLEGIIEAKRMVAQELMRENFSNEYIVKITRLDVESVRKLKETMEC